MATLLFYRLMLIIIKAHRGQRMKTHWILAFMAIGGLWASQGWASVKVRHLTCEYRDNPLGIDESVPRLAWQLQSDDRGTRQTAYQILVASTPDLLDSDQGDLWNTGKVVSDESCQIAYAGKTLISQQKCYWKVRVYNEADKQSDWSISAFWSMGLLTSTDWQGRWIGLQVQDSIRPVEACHWIGVPKKNQKGVNDLPGKRYYVKKFSIAVNSNIKRAQLVMAGDDSYTCWINGTQVLRGFSFASALSTDVTAHLKSGTNIIAVQVVNGMDKANPSGLLSKLVVEYANKSTEIISSDGTWRGASENSDGWNTSEYDHSAWGNVSDFGNVGIAPWGKVQMSNEDRELPARMLRKEFTVTRRVTRATAYFSGLGLSELYVNGKKVSADVLSPGLTHYTKRALYVTYDVTRLVKVGKNAMGIWLGNGRYYAPRITVPMKTLHYGAPQALLQLEIEYDDGSRRTVVTESTWRMTDQGPIRANNEYDGEWYDARMEMRGWADAGFDDSSWPLVDVVDAPQGRLAAQMIQPIRVTGTIKPLSVREPNPGVYIYDMGQNFVGWCKLTVKGRAGTAVRLRHAELLKQDGTLYMDNIRGAKVADVYVLKGSGNEVYEPRFTYHGFRYVEVTGYPGKPDLQVIEGCVVNDDMSESGTFTCSKPIINQIYKNIFWGTRGNYRSIPTDCPQRDERQGWLGDRSCEAKGETYLYDVAAFYTKWLHDMTDAQSDQGSVPDVCPPYWPLYNDNVTWPSSVVIIPGMLYEHYGDVRILERQYPTMAKWITHMTSYIKDSIMPRDTYGDWCMPPEKLTLIHSQDPTRKTKASLLGSTYFYHCLTLMAKYATILRKVEDAKRYQEQADALKSAMNAAFFDKAKGYYDNGTQTACVLPLAYNMVPEGEHERVFSHLLDKIQNETKGHIGTGLIGGQWLNRVLTERGRADISYAFATHTNYPSWGYMIKNGATTIWELWNGNTADPAMNSGNHVMLVGDLLIWLHESLAGIAPDPAIPGFKSVVMRPQMVGDLEWVSAKYNSQYGEIESSWKKGVRTEWKINIPPNARATLYVPSQSKAMISESGKAVEQVKEVKWLRDEKGCSVFEISSGRYTFTW